MIAVLTPTTSPRDDASGRALVEHEIHHRGQIYLYLSMLDVKTPPIYGMTSEEVREKSVR